MDKVKKGFIGDEPINWHENFHLQEAKQESYHVLTIDMRKNDHLTYNLCFLVFDVLVFCLISQAK